MADDQAKVKLYWWVPYFNIAPRCSPGPVNVEVRINVRVG